MRLRGAQPALLALGSVAAVLAGFLFSPSAGQATARPLNSAADRRNAAIGALFTITSSGQLGSHFCTASVVDSPAGNLVLTAAHCLRGRAAGQIVFVPGYADGQRPFGTFGVTAVLEDQRWRSSADPDDDFAFLVVRQPGTTTPVEDLTGGESVGIGAAAGRTVRVAGYPNSRQEPVTCENTARAVSLTQFQFDCGGFTDGTSGSPLLAGSGPSGRPGTVIGVIGGYEQGGDTPSVSYAARFGRRLAILYQQAQAAGAAS